MFRSIFRQARSGRRRQAPGARGFRGSDAGVQPCRLAGRCRHCAPAFWSTRPSLALDRELSGLAQLEVAQAAKERGWATLQRELERHPVRTADPGGGQARDQGRGPCGRRRSDPHDAFHAAALGSGFRCRRRDRHGRRAGRGVRHLWRWLAGIRRQRHHHHRRRFGRHLRHHRAAPPSPPRSATHRPAPPSTITDTTRWHHQAPPSIPPGHHAEHRHHRRLHRTPSLRTTHRSLDHHRPSSSTPPPSAKATARSAVSHLAELVVTGDTSGRSQPGGLRRPTDSLAQMIMSLTEPYGYTVTGAQSLSGDTVRVTLEINDRVADGQRRTERDRQNLRHQGPSGRRRRRDNRHQRGIVTRTMSDMELSSINPRSRYTRQSVQLVCTFLLV